MHVGDVEVCIPLPAAVRSALIGMFAFSLLGLDVLPGGCNNNLIIRRIPLSAKVKPYPLLFRCRRQDNNWVKRCVFVLRSEMAGRGGPASRSLLSQRNLFVASFG